MKQAVLYASKTGHSKKIAEGIAKALNLVAEDVKQEPKLENIDLLYIVGGIYAGNSLPGLMKYMQTIDKTSVKKVVLMTSCVSGKSKQDMLRELLTKKGIAVVEEEFVCFGKFLLMKTKHPDQKDIENAISFAKVQGGCE